MPTLYELEKYFPPTGTAESEAHILLDAFVPLSNYLEIINPPHASPRLLVGKKGSGKSAFMVVLRDRLSHSGLPAVLVKPEDISAEQFFQESSIGQLVKQATAALLDAVAGKLGSELSGFLTNTDEIALLKHAQNTGKKDKDFIQKTLQLLAPLGTGVTKIDFVKMAKEFGVVKDEEVKRAIVTNLGNSGTIFYLLLDDTDQVANFNDPHHLNRIWAFLLAARTICSKCSNIRCIVTLRTEVWLRLQRDEASQRDQVDHFRGLVFWLNPGEVDVSNIVERRLALAANELGPPPANLYGLFFEGRDVVIPKSQETRSWRDFIVKRSRERPRDAVQLISLLCRTARADRHEKINARHVAASMATYSEERVDDLKREVDQECPQIKEIVGSFASLEYDQGSFTMSAEVLKRHMMTCPSRFGIKLFGNTLSPQNEEHAFTLWRFLFEVGLFAPRTGDAEQRKGYTHLNIRDHLDLVSKARWNDMQKYSWEVNPAYRDFLLSVHHRDTLGLTLPKGPKGPRPARRR